MLAKAEAVKLERRSSDNGLVRLIVVCTAARLNGPVQLTFLLPPALAASLWDDTAEALAGGPYDPCLDRYHLTTGAAVAAVAMREADEAAWRPTRPADGKEAES